MNIEHMHTMWKEHSEKLDECISLNNSLLRDKAIESRRSELDKLILARAIEGLLFFTIVFSLWNYMVSSWGLTAPFFSALVLNAFAIVGLAGNIGQIVLLKKIDFSNPVKETLTHLSVVRKHNLDVFKLIMLSIPFYMAYVFLGYDIAFGVDLFSLMAFETKVIFSVISVVVGALVISLIKQIKPENREDKMIGWLYEEISGKRLTHLLDELKNMK